jgi:hypothetical protein
MQTFVFPFFLLFCFCNIVSSLVMSCYLFSSFLFFLYSSFLFASLLHAVSSSCLSSPHSSLLFASRLHYSSFLSRGPAELNRLQRLLYPPGGSPLIIFFPFYICLRRQTCRSSIKIAMTSGSSRLVELSSSSLLSLSVSSSGSTSSSSFCAAVYAMSISSSS